MEYREFIEPSNIIPCTGRSETVLRKIPPRKVGSLEKFLVPDVLPSSRSVNSTDEGKSSKDIDIFGFTRTTGKTQHSGAMQRQEEKSNSDIILVSEILANPDTKIISGHHFPPKELHAEILLDRSGSAIAAPTEFQSANLGCQSSHGLSSDMISSQMSTAIGETMLQRGSRDVIYEVLSLLSGYTHAIPYPITKYYLESSGFNNFSPEIVQFVGLTAQKYVYDVLCDAIGNCKERMVRESAERGENTNSPITLTLTDLVPALKKYKENRK